MGRPKLNYKRGTQKHRIWEHLRTYGSATNHELRKISGALRYGARVWEINQDLQWPWLIQTRRVKRGVYKYTVIYGPVAG